MRYFLFFGNLLLPSSFVLCCSPVIHSDDQIYKLSVFLAEFTATEVFSNATHNITFERVVGKDKPSFPTTIYFPKDGENLLMSYVRGSIDIFTAKPVLRIELKDLESKEVLEPSGRARLTFGQFKLELQVWSDASQNDKYTTYETQEKDEKYRSAFPYSFRRGKEPFQLSIYSNSSYVRHKPEDFEVWRDYPHYASKPGGLKKGFDKLASKNILKCNIFMVQELA